MKLQYWFARRFGVVAAIAAILTAAVGLWTHSHQRQTDKELVAMSGLRAIPAPPELFAPASHLPSITGSIRDPDGKPIAGAHVCAIPSSGQALMPVGSVCSDASPNGRYALAGLARGGYVVSASASGFAMGSAREGKPVVVQRDEPTEVDLVLYPGGARVTGVVVDATGGPVPHATIRAERTVAPRADILVEADDRGHFQLSFPSGPIVVSATAEAYAPARLVGLAPSVDVRLVLTPGATIRGVVVSALDGEPVPDIEVRAAAVASPYSPLFQSSVSRGDGTFDIRGLEPGTFVLIGTGAAWRGEYPSPIALSLGTTVEKVRLEVRPTAQVSGRVLLADTEQPCQQGVVRLGPPDPRQPPPVEEGASHSATPWRGVELAAGIEADGVARFPAVPPGRYYATVQCLENVLRRGPRVLDVGTVSLSNLTWEVGPGSSRATASSLRELARCTCTSLDRSPFRRRSPRRSDRIHRGLLVECPIALGAPMTTGSRSRSSVRGTRTCSRSWRSRAPRR